MAGTTPVKVRLHVEGPESVRRLGQALWMMVGEPIGPEDLLWARGLLGENGETVLWKALCENAVVREPDFALRPRPLADFLCSLWRNEPEEQPGARLVWTLPAQLTIDGIARDSYLQAAVQMVESATATLTFVAPYLEPKGMGWLHTGLLGALQRSVAVRIVTHDVDDLSSLASNSLEALRRDSARMPGSLTVFTASTMPYVLLHLKIVVADELRAIVGSANVTGKGFGANLEAGVLLGQDAAREIGRVVQATIECGLVTRAYSNERGRSDR